MLSHPIDELRKAAKKARLQAYAPYSHFLVGCALSLNNLEIVTGANVENCSYGLTLCAERAAISQAVLLGLKPGQLQLVVVVAQANDFFAPCGACRQVLAEFGGEHTRIILENIQNNTVKEVLLKELLPYAFTPMDLS